MKKYSQALDDVSLSLKYLKSSNLNEEKQQSKERELKKVASLMEKELKNFQSGEQTIIPAPDKNVEILTLDNPNSRQSAERTFLEFSRTDKFTKNHPM